MTSVRQLDAMKSVDIRSVDKIALTDVRSIPFDNSLLRRERIEQMIEAIKNPYCFRFGDLGVRITFTEEGPTLSDLLADFFLRKKSGL